MKRILLLAFITIGLGATAQNMPTIHSYTVDTLCEGDSDKRFISITIEDLDGDSTYIDVVTYNNAILDGNGGYTVVNPPYTPGATLRTIEVYGTANWGLPQGVNLADVNFEFYGHPINDPQGGASDQDINDIPVYGPIDVQWTVSDLYYCANDFNADDLSQYVVQQGGDFSWYAGSESYTTNMFTPELGYPDFVQSGGEYYIDYYWTNSSGCQGYNMVGIIYHDAPEIDVVETPSTCQNADGSAVATITSGTAPFDVYWTTGFSEQVSTTSTENNLSSGVYYINVEDANGCKNVGKANVYDSDITVTPTVTPQYCEGQTGQVDLSVNVQSGSVDNIFWSNGITAQNLTAPAGEYSVEIHTTTNCNFFGTYEIPDSSLRIEVDSYGGNNNCGFTPDGYINVSTYGGQGAYTWDWTMNMSPFATSEDISGIEGAWYECTVQDGNGCSLNWGKMIENYSNNSIWTYQVTPATCGGADGAIDMNVDTIWGDVPTFYEWNTGATSEDLAGLAAGSYTLTHTDQGGCTSKIRVEVPNELPYQPEICLLTVDTSYTYNQVVWEKVPGYPIDGFRIYRETSVFGEFELIEDRAYNEVSYFIDNAASPVDRSWRYYITTYDACGGESYASFIHKTIHIVSSDAGGGTFNVSWDKYEGLDYTDVDLYRHTNSGGWQNIGTYGIGQLSTTDTPPETAGLDYIVSFNLASTCTATKAQDYNSSRSNTTSSNFEGGEIIDYTVKVDDKDLGMISIYPNPTNDLLNVYIENPDEFEVIEIRGANGQLIQTSGITNSNLQFDFTDFASGLYFVSLISEDKIINHKIIKR